PARRSTPTPCSFQAEDGIRCFHVTGVQTCALPILFCQRLAELQQVCAGLHADRERDRGLTVVPEQRPGRIEVAPRDGCDIGQREIGRASCRERAWRPESGGFADGSQSDYLTATLMV